MKSILTSSALSLVLVSSMATAHGGKPESPGNSGNHGNSIHGNPDHPGNAGHHGRPPAVNTTERGITYMPAGGYAPTVATTYIDASATVALEPGQKIADLTLRNFAGEVTLQKLTDQSYWVQTSFYNSLFLVGKDSVLLIDPLGGAGEALLSAIRSITDKPIDTIILSHHHPDHVGDLSLFAELASQEGHELRVIASAESAEHVEGETDVIGANEDTVWFEDQSIRLVRYNTPAHTYDSTAWLLVEQGILHAPDMLNPDQLPYRNFGGSETFKGFEDNINTLAEQEFTFFSGGHGNIGGPQDVAFMQQWLSDLQQAVLESYEAANIANYQVAEYNNHHASATAWYDAINKAALDALRPVYGDYYGFEASVPVQIQMVRDAIEHQ